MRVTNKNVTRHQNLLAMPRRVQLVKDIVHVFICACCLTGLLLSGMTICLPRLLQSVWYHKSKIESCDISDVDTYTAVPLSPALYKVLGYVVLLVYVHLGTNSDVGCFQFGLKTGHLTTFLYQCTEKGMASHEFAYFIDCRPTQFHEALSSVLGNHS